MTLTASAYINEHVSGMQVRKILVDRDSKLLGWQATFRHIYVAACQHISKHVACVQVRKILDDKDNSSSAASLRTIGRSAQLESPN